MPIMPNTDLIRPLNDPMQMIGDMQKLQAGNIANRANQQALDDANSPEAKYAKASELAKIGINYVDSPESFEELKGHVARLSPELGAQIKDTPFEQVDVIRQRMQGSRGHASQAKPQIFAGADDMYTLDENGQPVALGVGLKQTGSPARKKLIKTDTGYGYVDEDGNYEPINDASGASIKPPPTASDQPKAFTQDQSNAASYGLRLQNSNNIITDIGTAYSPIGASAKGALGMFATPFVSKNSQSIEQAQRDFINATLRRESGATISPSEFDNAKRQYFPQAGEPPEIGAQKAKNRELVLMGFKNAAGKAWMDLPVDSAQPSPNSTGSKRIKYAALEQRANERFGGDIDAARQAAMSQGYEIIP
jgi:hypothetical protein